jgi:protein-ribulosamine 3-kinase
VCHAVAALGDDPIKEWILTEGKATKITGTRSIGGGCINSAQRCDTDAGPFFVKTNRCATSKMYYELIITLFLSAMILMTISE